AKRARAVLGERPVLWTVRFRRGGRGPAGPSKRESPSCAMSQKCFLIGSDAPEWAGRIPDCMRALFEVLSAEMGTVAGFAVWAPADPRAEGVPYLAVRML